MSIYYDLYKSGNPRNLDEPQPLYARVIPRGAIPADKFLELVSKTNGFSPAILGGTLQAITDELQRWLADGWTVELGELGYFSLSLRCDRPVMEKKEIRSPSIHLNNVNLRINKQFRKKFDSMELERMQSPYISHSNLGKEEGFKKLMEHLDKHGCITRSDFMQLTGFGKVQAIGLLNQFIEEGSIRKYGSGKTVVYLKSS